MDTAVQKVLPCTSASYTLHIFLTSISSAFPNMHLPCKGSPRQSTSAVSGRMFQVCYYHNCVLLACMALPVQVTAVSIHNHKCYSGPITLQGTDAGLSYHMQMACTLWSMNVLS